MRSARWPTVWRASSSAVWNLILKRDSTATMRLMWLKESHSGTSAAVSSGVRTRVSSVGRGELGREDEGVVVEEVVEDGGELGVDFFGLHVARLYRATTSGKWSVTRGKRGEGLLITYHWPLITVF